ncbi:MAG: thioredoxin [Gemmatimonadota bacterium]|nr:thioredoxin [Gemmatimonadota bacterium]
MTAQPQPARPATVKCPFCGTLNRVDLARVSDLPKCGECKRPIRLDRPIAVDTASFDKVIQGTSVPVLVDFYADWCGPCRIMAPMLDELAHERTGEVLVLKLDTDANPALTQRFGIRGIPTLIAFRGGKESGREVGVVELGRMRALVQL